MIELRDLSIVYGRTVALDSVTLSIGVGITGLFGPNAAGKSTLLRAVAGLVKPASGVVAIDGRAEHDEASRGRIGYVGHESGLYPDLTVAENLAVFARLYGVDPERVPALVDQLGLTDRAATRVQELSSGLKRRAAVARALLHQPAFLLLDEPYANLDDDAAELVSDAVKAWRAPGRAAVIASHGAKRVKSFADASVILQHGRVVSHRVRTEEGAPS